MGLVIAPIIPIEDWQRHYVELLDAIETALDFDCDLAFELISHRFTLGSKQVLQSWHSRSQLNLDEASCTDKRNKFGGTKYVYDSTTMKSLRHFFELEISRRFPHDQVLCWT